MADEEIGEIVLLLQVAQQIDHLRLHAHVERRGRLVEHDEARLQHHGAGNGDALALAAGEFMRIAPAGQRIEADFLQRPADALVAFFCDSDRSCTFRPFGDDIADRHAGAERAVGILEDDLQLVAQRPHLSERISRLCPCRRS